MSLQRRCLSGHAFSDVLQDNNKEGLLRKKRYKIIQKTISASIGKGRRRF